MSKNKKAANEELVDQGARDGQFEKEQLTELNMELNNKMRKHKEL